MARQPAGMRARDIDRATAATALDNAYSEGQLSFDEHQARVARARSAKTLGELQAVVADLQAPVELPDPPMPRAPSRVTTVPILLGAAVLVGVVAIVAWLVMRSGASDGNASSAVAVPTSTAASTTAPPPPSGVVPIIAPKVNFATADGIRLYVDLYRAKFGDTIADDVTFYPDDDYATSSRAVEPNRSQDFLFRGGFDPGSVSSRDPKAPVLDIGTVDIDRLVELMAGATQTVGVPDATLGHIMFEVDDGAPQLRIYVSTETNSGGYIEATFAGEITRVASYGH